MPTTRLKHAYSSKLSFECVQLQVQTLVLQQQCTREAICSGLGVHPRTLNRHLRKYGTTFKRMATDARFALAVELLEKTDKPASAIAIELGFSEPSVFFREFHGRSGETPQQWRTRKFTLDPDCQEKTMLELYRTK